MEHSPYSPDLVPFVFIHMLPKIEAQMQGTRLKSVDEVKAKTTQFLNSLSEDDFQHCFAQWKLRMERCAAMERDYFKVDSCFIVKFYN